MQTQSEYWDNRWQNKETGWDIGYATPAITEFIRKIEEKDLAILIPGCGNAYEAEYLLEKGFKNITLIDISKSLTETLIKRYNGNRRIRIIHGDFFDLNESFDIIIEQTFFCAIPPIKRPDYKTKTHQLLKENGFIVGVMFDKQFEKEGPPHSGTKKEYYELFSDIFHIEKMEPCTSSIPSRQGSELFVKMLKK
jgi:methyl halide transferase